MRTIIFAIAGFLAANIATAADVSKAPSPIAAPVSWTGFYVGINAGAGMTDTSIIDSDCFICSDTKFQTAFATVGGQVGYNWQWRRMVLGLEGDGNWASAKGSGDLALCCSSLRLGSEAHSKFDAFASIRGRLGAAFDDALIYVTAGPAWGHFKSGTNVVLNSDFLPQSFTSKDNAWHPGLAIGAGAEFMLTNNWTLRGEYVFLSFRDITRPFIDALGRDPATCGDAVNCHVKYTYSAHVARLGVNYRFGGF